MHTLIVNKQNLNIFLTLSGNSQQNGVTVAQYENNENYEVIEYDGESPFKAILDAGSIIIVRDDDKILFASKKVKESELRIKKDSILRVGFETDGIIINPSGNIPGLVKFDYINDLDNINNMMSRLSNTQKVSGQNQNNKFLKGRAEYKHFNAEKIGYCEFTNINSFFVFAEEFNDKLHHVNIIFNEKIEQLYSLGTVEDIESFDPLAGWEEVE